jgi:hypothetical protein
VAPVKYSQWMAHIGKPTRSHVIVLRQVCVHLASFFVPFSRITKLHEP